MTDPYPPDGRTEPTPGDQPEASNPSSAAPGPAATPPAGPDPLPAVPAPTPSAAGDPAPQPAGAAPTPGAGAPGVPPEAVPSTAVATATTSGPGAEATPGAAGPVGSTPAGAPSSETAAHPGLSSPYLGAPGAEPAPGANAPYPPSPSNAPYPPAPEGAPYPPASYSPTSGPAPQSTAAEAGPYQPMPGPGQQPAPGAEPSADGAARWSDATSSWSVQPPVGGQPPFGGGPGQPMPAGGPGWPAPSPQRSRLGTVVAVIAIVLVVVTVVQTVLLVETNSALGDQKKSAVAAGEKNDRRLAKLENDVDGLRQRVKKSLDSAGVAAKVLPSVFQVDAGEYLGTGFVVGAAPGGGTYLLTNHHVVEHLLASGSKSVKLERSGGSYPAKVVKYDADKDIALLECDESFHVLPVVDKPVRSGEPVVAVGSPLGLGSSVTTGVVSSPERAVPGSADKFIQFDAAINPGNSGGPVVNADGQVVGIATEKARDAEGIGLAIPISVPCDQFSVCGK